MLEQPCNFYFHREEPNDTTKTKTHGDGPQHR